MTTARRLAAILTTDVVGYSRPMGQDEAGTAKAVHEGHEASTPIVARHGGRIVKTAGDGLLLEFSSVVAAAECAIAIQKLFAERNAGYFGVFSVRIPAAMISRLLARCRTSQSASPARSRVWGAAV
jgi:class 3 adenylate cyclase